MSRFVGTAVWLIVGVVASRGLAEQLSLTETRFGVVTPVIMSAGSISPDGREVSFIDERTGRLGACALETGEIRYLTVATDRERPINNSVWSPDGSQLAYAWRNTDSSLDLRISNRAGGQQSTLMKGAELSWLSPLAWSPSGQHVLVAMEKPGGATAVRLALVFPSDFKVVEIASSNSRPGDATFSPDGRYIAFDGAAPGDTKRSTLRIIALDGTTMSPTTDSVVDERLIAWLADNRLIVSRSRSNVTEAWAIQTKDGRPVGQPRALNHRTFGVMALGVGRDGQVYVRRTVAARHIYLAQLDPVSGKVVGAPTVLPSATEGVHRREPVWSPDGDRLAYFVSSGSSESVAIWSASSGKTQTLPVPLRDPDHFVWRPDGRSLTVDGRGADGRQMTFRLVIEGGQLEPVGDWLIWGYSPDGRSSYGARSRSERGPGIVRRLNDERPGEPLLSEPVFGVRISPDGEWLAYFSQQRGGGSLNLVRSSGGTSRVLVPNVNSGYDRLAWSPDSQHVFYQHQTEMFRVAISSGAPEPIGLRTTGEHGHLTELGLNRDGRRLILDIAQNPDVRAWRIH